jgi:iron(III) transport system substrate-binding protein
MAPHMFLRRRSRSLAPAALLLALAACTKEPDVVVYCALDQVFSEELLRDFERKTGLDVRAEFDVEAAKTVGLVARIREERARPRCDVFWNNEIAHTVALADDGLLQPYASPSAAAIPERFKDPQGRWTGFAARARVLIVNTELADPATIRGVDDLLDPKWKGKACMARPLTGTTLTHVTALSAAKGVEAADAWLQRLQDAGVQFVQSNGQVMRLVREGQMALGLTDTDDFNVARLGGYPVAQVVPDQRDAEHPDAAGTLLIPNTVAILADAPHPEAARKLADFLLSEEVEAKLAEYDGAQIPLRPGVARPAHVLDASKLTLIEVEWPAVGRAIQGRLEALKERFLK